MHIPDGMLSLTHCAVYWLISIPTPWGVSIHFFGVPLVVILLGPLTAVIVAFCCLSIQYLLLGMGGITTLGANTFAIGICLGISVL